MRKIYTQGIKPKFFVKKALKKLIGKHGVVSLTRVSVKKRSKWGRRLNKANKSVNKALTKINKNIKKANKIASKSINTATKFYKALRKYK